MTAGPSDRLTVRKAALARVRQKWQYDPKTDLAALAAACGFGISQHHPFLDGNKRVAFLVMATFLGINGHQLDAPEPEVVTAMLALAAGKSTEADLAAWVRARARRAD